MPTVIEMLERNGEAAIVTAENKIPLTGVNIVSMVQSGRIDILNNRRVAVIGTDCAELAALLLAVSCVGTAAPINPALTTREYAAEFMGLGVDGVIIQQESCEPALIAARELGLPISIFRPSNDDIAGSFILEGDFPAKGQRDRNGIAFVMRTSGTTGRSKVVPLVEDKITVTAANIAARLELTWSDRTISLMPLFHVHGLLNILFPAVISKSSVHYLGPFDPLEAVEWLRSNKVSWLSAVPAIHHMLLNAAGVRSLLKLDGLRLVRSSSAPLNSKLRMRIEEFYNAPVIESYGMTEIDQIASQALPPLIAKPGSVGKSGGPVIKIMSPDGVELGTNLVGEICVKGPNCFPGYELDEEANKLAFRDTFFRTGDLGRMDQDGDLWLIGRAKEIINRGGEKISPLEIDDVMNRHPSVSEAACYSVPHDVLGEDVGLLVVLKDPELDPMELLLYASQHLAPFKIPAKITKVQFLPRGPTGKLLRRSMHEFQCQIVREQSRSGVHDAVSSIWREVLGVESIAPSCRFVDLGGSSHSAAKVLNKLEEHFKIRIPLAVIAKAETIDDLVHALSSLLEKRQVNGN